MLNPESSIYEQTFLIEELPVHIRDLLIKSSLPWLNSLEFCIGYGDNSAQYVWLRMNLETVYEAVFFNVVKNLFFNRVEVLGFPDATDERIMQLAKIYDAQLAVVNRIENAVQLNEEWQSKHRHIWLNTYITILKLPLSKDEYLLKLGKNKRKQLPQWFRRLNKYFNDEIEICYESKSEIRLDDSIQLELLNKSWRASKGKAVDSDKVIKQRQEDLFPLIESHGLMVTLRHRGRIIAGNLNIIYGNKAYMIVTGHDLEFEILRAGNLCIWKTIEYLIDNSMTECNFLWGRKFYKTQFLGVEYPWSIHILSHNHQLAIFWKYKVHLYEIYSRYLQYAVNKFTSIIGR